ncbi:MAG TPA: Gfo/Idh/MocA family oxidoreductase [bacterium]|uniref:Putative oxidoreductase YvaA n=1 Tax=candidate division TA06 bacterium ADurb.Bin417 TaxID=1852828 RepID=A0A1V5MH34_UNCT6|nr:MAG: putative oxidoreductase YvaA [candidate division TA06 bacterium ADurb.Bin417]HNQ35062.1 Gfo/Idh/MocA family oxidoreductase [bacterium]HNS48431.1 Gfo/Idh/MocA family oxidoreductase [bacterium]
MSREIRVGIAGLGRTGWFNHAKTLETMAGSYRITAVQDPNADRQKEAAGAFGCRTYSDFDQLLADPEVELVVVATPTMLHTEQTIAALKAGKMVVCEKPLATTAAEVDRMIAAARTTGRLFTIFQVRRYAPDFLKIREILSSGCLGRILTIKIYAHNFSRRWDWQTLRKHGGGILFNHGSHYLDQVLLLMPPGEIELFCHLERVLALGDAEDHAKLVLRAGNGLVADLELTSSSAYSQDFWFIMGNQGGLRGSASRLQWKYFDPARLPKKELDEAPVADRTYNRDQIPWEPEQEWTAPTGQPSPSSLFYRDLYQTIVNGAPLAVTPESVRRQVALLEKCHQMAGI